MTNIHAALLVQGYIPERRLEEPTLNIGNVVKDLERQKRAGMIKHYALVPEEFARESSYAHWSAESGLILYVKRS